MLMDFETSIYERETNASHNHFYYTLTFLSLLTSTDSQEMHQWSASLFLFFSTFMVFLFSLLSDYPYSSTNQHEQAHSSDHLLYYL